MSMSLFLQTLTSGVLLGMIYMVVAVGLSLTMGVLRIVNVSHSGFLIFAAFILIALVNGGMDPFLALLIIVPAFAAVGYLLGATTVRRISREPPTTGLLVLFGVMVFLEASAIVLWTTDTRTMSPGYLGFSLTGVGGVTIPAPRLTAAVLAIVSMTALYLFLQRTMTGRSIRAMAQNRDAAAMVGIRVERLDALVFAIGTGMAGIGGAALGMAFALAPQLHIRWLAWAFLVVVLGGLGNVRNTAVAALTLGLIESFAGAILPFHYVYVIVYGTLAAALLVRSEGLMGTRARTI